MTRKDYEVVAEIVAEIGVTCNSNRLDAGTTAARVLREHYRNFDMIKFFRYLDKLEKEMVHDL